MKMVESIQGNICDSCIAGMVEVWFIEQFFKFVMQSCKLG